MKRGIPGGAWAVAVIVIALAVLSAFTGGRSSDPDPLKTRSTTYSSGRQGLKALYAVLRKMRCPVRRNLAPLTTMPPDGTLIIANPNAVVTDMEWDTIEGWVKRGNLLIYCRDGVPPILLDGKESLTASHPAIPSFLTQRVSNVVVPVDDARSSGDWAWRSSGAPVGASEPRATALFSVDGDSTVVVSKLGTGLIVQTRSAWPLSNAGVGKGDNLPLVLSMIRARSGGLPVTFDEFHHGYSSNQGVWSLIGGPARLGLGQLLLAFILLVYGVSRRFGRPSPLQEGARQRNEYLTAMASLLRRAGASDAAGKELSRRFAEDVRVALCLPPNASVKEILARARTRWPEKIGELERLLSVGAGGRKHDESNLLSTAVAMHDMRKELMRRR